MTAKIIDGKKIADGILDKLKTKGVREVLKKPLQLDSLVATLEAVSKS